MYAAALNNGWSERSRLNIAFAAKSSGCTGVIGDLDVVPEVEEVGEYVDGEDVG